tara:strand:- start:293 stop:703 length:411 start_codon:yes stop_codon:yes gene_type:complete
MKKTQLKELIKPLVKECIHEVLIEEGLLSNVVAEVAKGMQQTTLVEARQAPSPPPEARRMQEKTIASRQKLVAHKKSLMESIGQDAYNGVNLFEGTEALSNSQPAGGQTDLGDPRDAGVDIASLMGKRSAVWEALK